MLTINATTGVVSKDTIYDITKITLSKLSMDSIVVNTSIVMGGETFYNNRQTMDDESIIIFPTSVAGIGNVSVGDGSTWAIFSFTTDGVVTLIHNSVDVDDDSATDNAFDIYDNGSGIAVKNRLGSTKYVRFNIHYSTN